MLLHSRSKVVATSVSLSSSVQRWIRGVGIHVSSDRLVHAHQIDLSWNLVRCQTNVSDFCCGACKSEHARSSRDSWSNHTTAKGDPVVLDKCMVRALLKSQSHDKHSSLLMGPGSPNLTSSISDIERQTLGWGCRIHMFKPQLSQRITNPALSNFLPEALNLKLQVGTRGLL